MKVRNFDNTATDYNLVIQGENRHIKKNLTITEMLSRKEVFYEYENGNIIICDHVEVNETKIFKISGALLQREEIIALYLFEYNPSTISLGIGVMNPTISEFLNAKMREMISLS